MSNNALFTIEQVDNKLIITVEAVKVEHPNPTMIRSNDGNTETIEFVDPTLTINTDKVGLDLSKYKPFPEKFIVPKWKKIRAIKIYKEDDYIKYGAIGTIVGDGTYHPKFNCDNLHDRPTRYDLETQLFENIKFLAPLDPSDHPDYKPEEPEQRPMNADEIANWARNKFNLSTYDEINLRNNILNLLDYELNKAKR